MKQHVSSHDHSSQSIVLALVGEMASYCFTYQIQNLLFAAHTAAKYQLGISMTHAVKTGQRQFSKKNAAA